MPRERISNSEKWTDTEKLQVLLSIIDSGTKIDWDKVYIPEGRTRKAVMCMLDVSKRAVRNGGAAANNAIKKTKAATEGNKRKRGNDQVDEDDEEEQLNRVKKGKSMRAREQQARTGVKTRANPRVRPRVVIRTRVVKMTKRMS
ncbi:hypothetical protein MMC30_002084 [Trapelia coarctata]|nr:hypothetical protein [Trapelia coarctata]